MVTVDGGELGCGELLLLVQRTTRGAASGTRVAIVTTDPGAPLDIPAWCHLTGHRYLGRSPDGYLVELTAAARRVDPCNAWRVSATTAAPTQEIH